MLHNARCGNLRCQWCEMWCGIRVMKNVAYARCCVTSDVENDTMCCGVRCGGEMWCGIWCGVKCAMMLNVGVVWNSGGCGMVWDVDCGCDVKMWNMLCFEMWWCEMVVGGRLVYRISHLGYYVSCECSGRWKAHDKCIIIIIIIIINVMAAVEYGGPRWDVLQH